MITREFNLYLHAGHSIPLVINVNQYDQGEQWLFTLFNADGTQYVPSSGAIVGIKSDNLGIINSGTVDSQGRVVINETQQMTAAVGKAVFELLIDDQTHGTANFIVLVEPKPGDNADLSESDYSLFQQAIDGTSAAAIAEGVADWMDENLTPTSPVVDASLTVQGAAADSAKVGQELSDLKSQISTLSAIPHDVKLAMDTLFHKMAIINTESESYAEEYSTIHTWATAVNLVSISAVYTQSGFVLEGDALDTLKDDLVVTALFDDGTEAEVTSYTLSGTLEDGTSTVTVTYEGKTTSFNVTVDSWTLTWSYEDGGLPAVVAPDDWTATIGSSGNITPTVTFENGIKFVSRGGGYTITPKNYQTTEVGAMEFIANFNTVPSGDYGKFNVRATLNTASDTLIGFLFKDGVKINGSGTGYNFIPNTSISLGEDHTLRVERNASKGKVYLDGNLVYSGELRELSGTNNVLISFVNNTTTACTLYLKAIRFYHES